MPSEPDQFFGKFVLRGNAADLQKIGKELGTADPAAWNDIRGQTVQWLTDKATNGKGADGTFSGSALRKAMDALGTQRLKALFTPEEFAQLQTLSKAASAATETPAFTRAGIGSNTAEKLANLLGKGAGLPWVNKMVVEPVQSAVQHSAVSRSLSSLATPPSAAPLVSQQLRSERGSLPSRSRCLSTERQIADESQRRTAQKNGARTSAIHESLCITSPA